MEENQTEILNLDKKAPTKSMGTAYFDILQHTFNYLVKHSFNDGDLFVEDEKKSDKDHHYYKAHYKELPQVNFEFSITPTDGSKTRYTFAYRTFNKKRTIGEYSHILDLFEYEDLQAKMLFLDENEVFQNFLYYNKEINAVLDKKKTAKDMEKWVKEINAKYGN